MAAEWFYRCMGEQLGPVEPAELRRLADAGAIMPDTPVCRATATHTADGRWVQAEKVQGLLQPGGSLPASVARQKESHSLPPPMPRSVPSVESGGPRRTDRRVVAGDLAAAGDLPEKPERIWPVTWAAIIVGSGTVLLLFWALVFRGGSATQQQANKDQPPLAAARSPAPESSAPLGRWSENDEPLDEPATTEEALPDWLLPVPPAAPGQPGYQPPTGGPVAKPPSTRPTSDGVTALDLADLAELVGPSVVQLKVSGPETAATGSGFVLDKQGTIVTNYHVIQDATEGTVVFSDKTSAPITGYLGAWSEKDIALVHVECPPDKLRPLRLATSSPRQGERVAAFGSPLGLAQSVSEGIVSAVRQSKELRILVPMEGNALWIQTTTPISHGNSGGPLVDMKGMVVGVNTIT
ncbi:MAG: trypsin-like peptidase domain-containing protein [Planctomycetota bacterium]